MNDVTITSSLVDHRGQAIVRARPRLSALNGGDQRWGGAPHDAADVFGDHMAAWRPMLWSPDNELNPYRDRIVSRVRDLVRNDGWASGAITRILDNAIGANFRPIPKPNYRAVAAYSGNPRFDAVWAREFGSALRSYWESWANDDAGRYCDAQRKLTFAQIMQLGFRHKLIDGDALAVMHWLPERIGEGRARYATAVLVVDPDRLSNPQLRYDSQTERGGVLIDAHGAAIGYYIRQAHQGDWWSAAKALTWDLIDRETDWGRPVVVHDFDAAERADKHRGGAGVLAPVVQRLKALIKYDGAELDAAIINAIFGAFVESPFDPQMVGEAFAGAESLGPYQDERIAFHKERRTVVGGAQVTQLFPGEKLEFAVANRPGGNHGAFEASMLRNVSQATGTSTQQITGDWSDVNYSSARAAAIEAWKTMHRRRHDFAAGFGAPIYSCFVEESMDVDPLPMPTGGEIPSFMECRSDYAAARWMGPGRGHIDPVKERQGAVLGMDAGLSTLEIEAAEASGEHWEDLLDQRMHEVAAFKERGLEPPNWAAMNAGLGPGPTAQQTVEKAEPD